MNPIYKSKLDTAINYIANAYYKLTGKYIYTGLLYQILMYMDIESLKRLETPVFELTYILTKRGLVPQELLEYIKTDAFELNKRVVRPIGKMNLDYLSDFEIGLMDDALDYIKDMLNSPEAIYNEILTSAILHKLTIPKAFILITGDSIAAGVLYYMLDKADVRDINDYNLYVDDIVTKIKNTYGMDEDVVMKSINKLVSLNLLEANPADKETHTISGYRLNLKAIYDLIKQTNTKEKSEVTDE